ncbi:DUF4214 domain-containing protein [Methylobacterium sp. WL69]|uniref:DUF4214 domain-containing protein n=1 Tax=Methylobacterium sp. WL69 TaxID=2603893 RepID=UPI0011C7D6EE|nr:DUF4214 domain-containing protein [Methylobacterium sp. WL69]TXM68851.1 DUF4214 domain-containing protein [Methylobacterium sp. WL69]
MALLLGGIGSAFGGLVSGISSTSGNILGEVVGITASTGSSSGQSSTVVDLNLGGLVGLNIGAGGTTSIIAIDGSIGATGSTSISPIINLGVDLGTGSTSGNGGLLGGLLGGGSYGNGGGLIPTTVDALLGTVGSLTGALTGGGTGSGPGGGTEGGTGGGTGGTGTIPLNPGTPGQVINGTEAADALHGTGGNDTINGLGGRDVIFGNSGNDLVDGGAGLDTFVAGGSLSSYNAASQNGVLALQNKSTGEIDYLMNVERLHFTDNKVLALDFNGNAGEAFRLYQAALDRAPESAGLKFHVDLLDRGVSLHDDAVGFINSPEFQQKYGANITNQQYITNLYENTLHRNPDAAGFAYYDNLLSSGARDRATVLINFSESPENHQQTDHQLQNGILLDYSVA